MRVLAPLALAFLAGCVCTDIGCPDGVSVRLQDAPQGPYTVELIPSSGPAQVVECDGAGPCSLFFEHVDADRATVVVTSQAGTVERDVRLHFEQQYPNGRLCGAACSYARVTVQV